MSTKLKILNVELGDKSYPIYIGRNLLSYNTYLKKHISGQQVMVVTNSKIEPLYLEKVKNLLGNFEVQVMILPDCLLYTSPSPRDRSLSRMPSSA